MRSSLMTLLSVLLALSLAACGTSSPGGSSPSASASAAPRTFTDDKQENVTIPGTVRRIVSTSVVLSGTLLALDAPLVGSGGSGPNVSGFDSHGWFLQWSKIAEERGVKSLYTNQKVDLEAIMAVQPDLIVVSKTGGDSAMEQYEQLKRIAPTVVIDYNSSDWRAVTTRVGDAIGSKSKADSVLASFAQDVEAAKGKIKAPSQPVNIGVYDPSGGLSVGLPTAPQALILKDLGITVKDEGVTPEKGRTDFAFTTPEQALQALRQDTLLLVGNSSSDRAALLADARFASLPSVKAGRVYELGSSSFKLDYYAAKDMLASVARAFPK